jgi:hypothetical protein
MATKLPAIFEMDPNKVPISKFPISRTQPIIDFNQVCYNTASEFVEGFNQDTVMQSKAGLYCKAGVKKLTRAIGKDPCQFRLPVPVINLRAKYFAEGLRKHKNDPEKARKYCIRKSLHNKNQEVGFCESAYTMYKQVYGDKEPPTLPKKRDCYPRKKRENYVEHIEENLDKKPPKEKGKANCWVVGIVSGIIVIMFIFLILMSINVLTTAE